MLLTVDGEVVRLFCETIDAINKCKKSDADLSGPEEERETDDRMECLQHSVPTSDRYPMSFRKVWMQIGYLVPEEDDHRLIDVLTEENIMRGISIRDLDLLTIGLVNDMYAENGNDDYKGYKELATQEDFDRF